MKVKEKERKISNLKSCAVVVLCSAGIASMVIGIVCVFWLLSDTSGTGGIPLENLECAIEMATFAFVLHTGLWWAGDELKWGKGKKNTT